MTPAPTSWLAVGEFGIDVDGSGNQQSGQADFTTPTRPRQAACDPAGAVVQMIWVYLGVDLRRPLRRTPQRHVAYGNPELDMTVPDPPTPPTRGSPRGEEEPCSALNIQKIQTVFMRDERNVIVPGEWTLPELAYLADKDWRWTEKVDGTNIRLALGR